MTLAGGDGPGWSGRGGRAVGYQGRRLSQGGGQLPRMRSELMSYNESESMEAWEFLPVERSPGFRQTRGVEARCVAEG
jgi:hypothetical protein